MSLATVKAGAYLHHLEICSPNPGKLAEFYELALQMQPEKTACGYTLRGPARRTLFTQGKAKTLSFAAFACRDRDSLDAIRAQAQSAGAKIEASPSPLFGGEAFGVRDPEGNLIVLGLAKAEPETNPAIRGPIQHVTVNSTDLDAMERFYDSVLGFGIIDRVRNDKGIVTTCFARSNHEHHSVGMFLKDVAELDHHSYEAGEWGTIKEWCDYLATHRIPVIWGPGRHGPGNNLFIFIQDPDDNMIEISAEMEVVHDRPVKEWKHEPYTLNMWGRAIMRS